MGATQKLAGIRASNEGHASTAMTDTIEGVAVPKLDMAALIATAATTTAEDGKTDANSSSA